MVVQVSEPAAHGRMSTPRAPEAAPSSLSPFAPVLACPPHPARAVGARSRPVPRAVGRSALCAWSALRSVVRPRAGRILSGPDCSAALRAFGRLAAWAPRCGALLASLRFRSSRVFPGLLVGVFSPRPRGSLRGACPLHGGPGPPVACI